MSRALADLRWTEAGEAGTSGVLAIPLGATEQHGPHLPLSTDSDIAVALAEEAAARLEQLTVAPLLPYGSSGEHEDFPGTISIGAKATELVLVEACRSASATFGRILLVSTHGGNAAPVRAAVALLREEGRDVRAWGPRWEGDAHAGALETSVMLALSAARVDLTRAAAGNATPIEQLAPRLAEEGVRAVAANGVLGDPGGASAEAGAILLQEAVEDLVRTVADWPV